MSLVNNVFFISVLIVPLTTLAYFCSLTTGPKGFLTCRLFFFMKTGVTLKGNVEKSIRGCQNDHLAEGYKRAIDEIRGPIAKTDFLAVVRFSANVKRPFLRM